MKSHSKGLVVAAVVAIGVLILPVALAAPNNGRSHGKATGGVDWVSMGGDGVALHSSFNAHDDAPGGDRGKYRVRRTDTGDSIRVDIRCVKVEGNEAWWGGLIVSGSGAWAALVGQWSERHVIDNGSSGTVGPDMIGGNVHDNQADACDFNAVAGGIVTGGNLTVHSSN